MIVSQAHLDYLCHVLITKHQEVQTKLMHLIV